MKTSTIRIIITLATVAAGIAAAFIGLTAGAAGYSAESYSMLMTRNPMAHIAGLPVWLAGAGWAAVSATASPPCAPLSAYAWQRLRP